MRLGLAYRATRTGRQILRTPINAQSALARFDSADRPAWASSTWLSINAMSTACGRVWADPPQASNAASPARAPSSPRPPARAAMLFLASSSPLNPLTATLHALELSLVALKGKTVRFMIVPIPCRRRRVRNNHTRPAPSTRLPTGRRNFIQKNHLSHLLHALAYSTICT